MAIPSGGGTEISKMNAQRITSPYTWTPDQHHIYVVLNIIFKNDAAASSYIHVEVSTDSGSNYIYLMQDQALDKDKTFVWNERLVLYDNTARLKIANNSSDQLDFVINYIDQDWS